MSNKNSTTLYHFVLDRSGSMRGIAGATIRGFNKQLAAIRELEEENEGQTYLTSFTIFNDHVDHILDPAPTHQMKTLNHENYIPGGTTALYDAIGESIVGVLRQFKKKLKKGTCRILIWCIYYSHLPIPTKVRLIKENHSKDRLVEHAVMMVAKRLGSKGLWRWLMSA